jgi:hypothetical protein
VDLPGVEPGSARTSSNSATCVVSDVAQDSVPVPRGRGVSGADAPRVPGTSTTGVSVSRPWRCRQVSGPNRSRREAERSSSDVVVRSYGFGQLFTWPTDQPRHALFASVPTSKPVQALNHFPFLCHAPHAHGPFHMSHGSVQALNCFGAHSGQGTMPVVASLPSLSWTACRCSSVSRIREA